MRLQNQKNFVIKHKLRCFSILMEKSFLVRQIYLLMFFCCIYKLLQIKTYKSNFMHEQKKCKPKRFSIVLRNSILFWIETIYNLLNGKKFIYTYYPLIKFEWIHHYIYYCFVEIKSKNWNIHGIIKTWWKLKKKTVSKSKWHKKASIAIFCIY